MWFPISFRIGCRGYPSDLSCRVPPEVLQSRYSLVCKIIADKLISYETSDSTALLKGVSLQQRIMQPLCIVS